MSNFDVVVIGASAGGVSSLQRVVQHIPATFDAAILVALHLPDDVRSMLPHILARAGKLPASHAVDDEPITKRHIYVAPPGFHLTVTRGRLHINRGAREHGHRPAIDPLFRSAAVAYGPRAIGVVLSGALYDGTVGINEIKRAGGIAIVQDPADTEYPSMPESALEHVAIDYTASAQEIGMLLTSLVEPASAAAVPNGDPIIVPNGEPTIIPNGDPTVVPNVVAREEIRELTRHEDERDHPGEPSPYSCPECGGVLWEIKDGQLMRFRCRVGHAYTGETLTAEQSLTVEHALWTALRALEEQAALRRRMADRAERHGQKFSTKRHRDYARELDQQAQQIRDLVLAGVGAPEETANEAP